MKIIKHILILFFISTCSFAEVKPSDLIQVTGATREKCVEYYTKQGTLFCSTKPTLNTPVSEEIINDEKQNIYFDDRVWKFAWGKKAPDVLTIEYVPMGENINDWNELVTSQFMGQIPPNISPRSLAERTINDLKKKGYDPVITFHKVTQDEVVFEFRIDKPDNQVQDEIQMIKKDNNGFYFLHYVIKQFDMGKESRDKWLQNFAKSTIK